MQALDDRWARSESNVHETSYKATMMLGHIVQRHFRALVEALEKHGDCLELHALEEDIADIQSLDPERPVPTPGR